MKMYCICFFACCVAQFMYCMEKPDIEIVVHIDQADQQAPAGPKDDESSKSDQGSQPSTIASKELAKKAVRLTLGEGNDYLERMLARRIDGKQATPKIIPIHRIPETTKRSVLRAYLAAKTQQEQQSAQKFLSSKQDTADQEGSPENPEQNQPVTRWVLNAILDEKLKDREVRENSDYWKYINGTLAAVLPVATIIIQYFLTHHTCDSGSN